MTALHLPAGVLCIHPGVPTRDDYDHMGRHRTLDSGERKGKTKVNPTLSELPGSIHSSELNATAE